MTVNYETLGRQLDALADTDSDRLALCANFVALLYAELPDINWLGFYIRRKDDLVLGPFQGLPACIRIPLGQGVCGSAAEQARTLRIADVHAFDGHIACDPVSRSELVVPLIEDGKVFAVLDIDRPLNDRFSEADESGVEALCGQLVGLLGRGGAPLDEFI